MTPAQSRTRSARTTARTISTCRPAEVSGLAVDAGWADAPYGGRYGCTGGPEGTEAAPRAPETGRGTGGYGGRALPVIGDPLGAAAAPECGRAAGLTCPTPADRTGWLAPAGCWAVVASAEAACRA